MSQVTANNQQLRRIQLGAALGSLGLVGASIDPFAEVFAGELAEVASVTTGGDLDHMTVETVVGTFDAASSWLELLHDHWEVGLDRTMAMEAMLMHWSAGPFTVSLTESRDAGHAACSVGVFSGLDAASTFAALSTVASDAASELDRLLGTLPTREPVGLRVVSTPSTGLQYQVDVAFDVAGDAVPASCDQLDALLESLGASAGQRRWFRATHTHLSPRRRNAIVVRFTLTKQGVQPTVRVSYAAIPAREALRLLPQFTQAPNPGQTLGALSAAMNAGDAVDSLHITVGDIEPPRIDVEYRATRPRV